MSDPGLLTIDQGPGGVERWAFIHNQDHNRLIAQASSRFNVVLPYRILDPIGIDFDQWLLDHQRAHDDMTDITGVIGSDLQTVDFTNARQRDAWLDLNEQEHAAFAAALGI